MTAIQTIQRPRPGIVMIERQDAGGRVVARRYGPAGRAAQYSAAGWIVWRPTAAGGWSR